MFRQAFVLCLIIVKAENLEIKGRIVGGELTTIANFPYQLSLQFYHTHSCGAALIGPTTVLTAAHCVNGLDPYLMSIRAGSTYWKTGGYQIFVQKVIVHPDYDEDTDVNDIAILKVANMTSKKGVSPIMLPKSEEVTPSGSIGVVTGWGYTKEEGALSRRLRKLTLKVTDQKLCKSLNQKIGNVTESMMCATGLQQNQDSCQGDSGGPFVVNGKLVGIVSWGYGCARPGYPGVYTRISKFRNWIDSLVGEDIRFVSSVNITNSRPKRTFFGIRF